MQAFHIDQPPIMIFAFPDKTRSNLPMAAKKPGEACFDAAYLKTGRHAF